MARVRALKRTKLSLPRFARKGGINPIHFAGARVDGLFNPSQYCTQFWGRHSWQDVGRVSHEDLANAIVDAENAIENFLGFHVAPTWVSETIYYPKYHRRGVFTNGINLSSQRVGVRAKWGKVIAGGVRGTTLMETVTVAGATLSYVDEDGDGFAEIAQLTVSDITVDPSEIKVYFAGTSADPRWEIRDPLSIVVGAATTVIRFSSWMFIDPDTFGAFPSSDGEWEAIDITTTANFVTSADVYREFNDTSQASVTFHWDALPSSCNGCGGIGCPECTPTTQDGCMVVADDENGYVMPIPATFGQTDWASASFTIGRSPDRVTLRYYAGEIADDFSLTLDPLDDLLSEPIFMLSVARLRRRICGCQNVMALFAELQENMAAVSPEGNFLAISEQIQNGAFGFKRGEWLAWKALDPIDKYVDFAMI